LSPQDSFSLLEKSAVDTSGTPGFKPVPSLVSIDLPFGSSGTSDSELAPSLEPHA
ncbi:hypothetical protein Tco_0504450, partial [Tanacetum coccineum]